MKKDPKIFANFLAFLLIIIVFGHSGIARAQHVDCPDKCLCTDMEISCRNVGLQKAPLLPSLKAYNRKILKIDLSQNFLRQIPDNYFQNFSNLQEILLDSNGLSYINAKAFLNSKIKTLSLNNNRLTKVPFLSLSGVKSSLKHLSLDRNIIEDLGESNFMQFKNLQHLNLANNLLAKILPNAFKGLENLISLKLGNNQIANISSMAFRGTPNIEQLDSSDNVLRTIPEALVNLPKLLKLSLYGNRIEKIPSGLLQNCPHMIEFNIRGNPLKAIDVDAFINLPKLEQLIISEARDVTQFPNLDGSSSLHLVRFDRSGITRVPEELCTYAPKLKSLEVKINQIKELPDLSECSDLRLMDFSHNNISDLFPEPKNNKTVHPLRGLTRLHDVLLSHNVIKQIPANAFQGLTSLQILDLSNNVIEEIDEDAFVGLERLKDINVGVNRFSKMPTKGLENVIHIKAHNNPELRDFPGSKTFPKVQSLVLSYAYHCCQFIPSTFENVLPDYTNSDFKNLDEIVIFPGDENFDHSLLHSNSSGFWNNKNFSSSTDLWANIGMDWGSEMMDTMYATPPPGIECFPAPGPFLPCNDLFDWWTLRCSVWIVFLLALLGNGCVVIVLICSRGKMDVPRFLVCNLAMADFFMGLYLGFLAVVDASTLGEFRKFALKWQFSPPCQAAGFFGVLSSELSVFTLAVITLERNYAITHAMHLNKRLSLKHASYIMACGWTFALIMATLPLLGISDYRKFAVCLPFETEDPLSLGYVIFLMFINGVAFSILMGCYLKMYCAIRGSQAWNSNDSRIAKRMALLVFTDFICWAPIAFFSLMACVGVHLISLEQAKVFTIFVLPLNSCCNPFLYAILTKQFKKDCVMICKAIEESRVTRGIGRCRHSSNFSNRQTPANTNSLNSGSGTHGSHSKGTICSCNSKKSKISASRLTASWPFNKIKHIFYGYREGQDQTLSNNESYAQQIAEIQHKQNKSKRHASVSSDNFSSSRSDSWRQHGHCIPGLRFPGRNQHNRHHHRRRNSWTVTRKPSQESQLSSSRNDSASSNSTNTWRMSRSSVSSEMSNSIARSGSGKNPNDSVSGSGATGKFSALAQRTQARAAAAAAAAAAAGGAAGISGIMKPSPLAKMAVENSEIFTSDASGSKPKLIRQSAILPDADSTGSGKSVTFQEPASGSGHRGPCPVHSSEYAVLLSNRYRSLYNKLIESNQDDEESDMEASDEEPESDSMPIGATYRTINPAQVLQQQQQQQQLLLQQANRAGSTGRLAVSFMPRKLSTISSKGSFGAKDEDELVPLSPEDKDVIKEEDEEEDNGSSQETRAIIESLPEKVDETVIPATSRNASADKTLEEERRAEKDDKEAEKESLIPKPSSSSTTDPLSTLPPLVPQPTTKTVIDGKRKYLNTDV